MKAVRKGSFSWNGNTKFVYQLTLSPEERETFDSLDFKEYAKEGNKQGIPVGEPILCSREFENQLPILEGRIYFGQTKEGKTVAKLDHNHAEQKASEATGGLVSRADLANALAKEFANRTLGKE